MKKITPKRFRELVSGFGKLKVLVVGDVMLDRFIWGRVSRISPEAPIPVVNIARESAALGGAANVLANLKSLGSSPLLSGLVGADTEGAEIVSRLRKLGVKPNGLVVIKDRPTTLKTRIIAHNQQVVRIDRETTERLENCYAERLINYCKRVIPRVHAVIISDYGKGVISLRLSRHILRLAKRFGIPVTVDLKTGRFLHYKGATLITPNHLEVGEEGTISRTGKGLLKKSGCRAVLITRGEKGMSLFEDGRVRHAPTVAKEVYDVTGAGDTVISAFTLALAGGAEMPESALISNYAAGVVVGKLGTATVSRDELLNYYEKNN